MPEEYPQVSLQNDSQMRIRDMEEKQRLLKERVILIGQNLVSTKEEILENLIMLKKMAFETREEQIKMKEFLQRLAQQSDELARKEELLILQRQLDLMRNSRGNE
ncbi:MAG: hypothetical protein AABW79_01990 [Nanoarchaeota archaeon]